MVSEPTTRKKIAGRTVISFFLKPYWKPLVLLFVLSVMVGVLEMIGVATVGPILELGLSIDSDQDNFILSMIGEAAELFGVDDIFVGYCILFIVVAVTAAVTKFLVVYLRTLVVARMLAKTKRNIFQKYMEADYQYFIDHKQGELIYNTSQAPLSIQPLITAVTTLLSEGIIMIAIFIFLIIESWVIAAVGIGLVGVYYFITRYLGTRISYLSGKERLQAGTEEDVAINEVVSGIRQVKVFNMHRSWMSKFNDAVKRYWEYQRRDAAWSQSMPIVLMLFVYCTIGIAGLIIKIHSGSEFKESIPIFGVFGFALLRLLPSMSKFGMLRMHIMASLPNCELVYSTLNERVSILEDGRKELTALDSNVALEHVSFSHKGRAGTITDASVVFEKGKTTAIVGASGAGKTTIVDLVLRLFDPDEGRVTVDNVDLKEYRLATWLDKIGFVSQDTFIFHETVRNNIAFGSKQYSDEDVIRAARNANAHDFIVEFPEGYDTIVGDRGMRLSGGQRQRIAIARAMIREPEILILDEATSALDNVSEAIVQEAIERISTDRTVIVVAHRLSTIIDADKIVVLANGRVVEVGTHKDLMGKDGTYYNLYKQGTDA